MFIGLLPPPITLAILFASMSIHSVLFSKGKKASFPAYPAITGVGFVNIPPFAIIKGI